MNKELFKGVFPALMTPFDTQGKIIWGAMEEYLEFCLSIGVKGFYINGSTGEFPYLTADERKKILEFVRKTVGSKAIIINHVGTTGTMQSVELARHSADWADAVSSVPPFYYSYSFDELFGFYKDVTEAASLPMIAYHIPALTGVSFSLEQLAKIYTIDNVAGVKFTDTDFYMMERIKTIYPDKLIYNGPDEMILCGISMGADGAIGSTYNIMYKKAAKIMESVLNSDYAAAKKEQTEMNNVIQVLLKVGVNPGCKYILDKKYGIYYGICRAPRKQSLTDEDKQLLDSVIKYI